MEKITAIGEILYDVYPETKNLGGAPLNFLYHVYKLTGKGNIISRVGNDVLGKHALDFLENSGINIGFVQIDHLHPTGITTVTLDEKKVPSFRIDDGRAYDFIEGTSEVENLVEKETDCLYFGSLAQRNEITRNTIQDLLGKEIKYFCDLNLRQNFYTEEIITRSIKSANVLKINIDELKLINEVIFKKEYSFERSTDDLLKNFKIEMLAVTKGAKGSTLFYKDEVDNCGNLSVEVVDTLGAGDSFASILCIGYLRGWKLRKINRLANEFASEICKIEGALPKTDEVYLKIKEKMNSE
jgi:fructokinase